jgi:hypothetical protein
VEKTVPPILENDEEFTDGHFYPTADHLKLMLYVDNLIKEIELLRAELEKFEE